VRTGTRNPASRGNDVVLDSLVVLDRIAPASVPGVTTSVRGLDVDTSWLGSPETDVEGYRVYRSEAGSPAARIAELSATERAFADPTAPVGVPMTYTVTAFDSSGNESVAAVGEQATIPAASAVRSGRWENTSAAISYTGTWATNSHSSDNGGSSAAAKAAGDYAQIAFDGSGVEWISRTGPYLGLADVYLDGAKVATVDLYSPIQQFQRSSFSAETPGDGVHKLRIVRVGARNAASTGNDIVLDTFVVLDSRPPAALASVTATPEGSTVTATWAASAARDLDGYRVYRSDNGAAPVKVAELAKGETTYSDPTAPIGTTVTYTVTAIDTSGNESVATAAAALIIDAAAVVSSSPYENTSDSITLSGTWAVNSHTSDSGGSSSAAKSAGDYGQIAFRESGVRWVSRTGPSLGIAEVYLDDVLVDTVDLYSPTQKFQQTVFQRDGLADGNHKLRIVRTGTRNAASSGNDIVIDSLVVTDANAPVTPVGFATSVERGGIGLAWTASDSADTVGYRVYRALGAGTLTDITDESGLVTKTAFLDVGLALGASYRFAVAAVDSSGNESALTPVLSQLQPDHDPVATRYANCPTGGTTVSTLTALRAAVAAAKPGTVIKLAPGTYAGNITVTTSGTAEKPIWICGPRTAVLDNNNVASKNGVLFSNVSHVNVAGFTIQNFRKGVMMTGSDHVSAADLMVRTIGEEAIKVRFDTTDSMVAYNTIQNTGRVVAMYGEGVYVGTSPKDWCDVFNCKEDNSDRNSVIGNNISGTTADPIEMKPGVTGGVVRNNRVDGASTISGTPLIAIKGNDVIVTDNIGTNGKWSRGIWAAETEVKGYGYNNILARNTMGVPVGGTAFYVGLNAGNIVDDSNVALVSGTNLSNTTIQK
jgi:fibronectin type 3 domain-containing protein